MYTEVPERIYPRLVRLPYVVGFLLLTCSRLRSYRALNATPFLCRVSEDTVCGNSKTETASGRAKVRMRQPIRLPFPAFHHEVVCSNVYSSYLRVCVERNRRGQPDCRCRRAGSRLAAVAGSAAEVAGDWVIGRLHSQPRVRRARREHSENPRNCPTG